MEELETPHPDYIKGFNDGYILAKHLPELAKKLPFTEMTSDKAKGMEDGIEQHALEQRRENYPAWRRTDWMNEIGNEPDISMEKDIEDPEPDI